MTPDSPFDFLSSADLDRILAEAKGAGARFAEVFAERSVTRSLRREEGSLRSITGDVEAGVGIRAVAGEGTGYAYTSETDLRWLLEAARSAGRIARSVTEGRTRTLSASSPRLSDSEFRVAPPAWEPAPGELDARGAFLEEVDRDARRSDPRVVEVSASASEQSRSLLLVNSEGRRVADREVLCGVSVGVYVRDGARTQRGTFGGGGRESFESLVAGRLDPHALASEAVRRAVVLL